MNWGDREIPTESGPCCLCAQPFTRWGFNPTPVIDDDDSRCCARCYNNVVMPHREYRARKEALRETAKAP